MYLIKALHFYKTEINKRKASFFLFDFCNILFE